MLPFLLILNETITVKPVYLKYLSILEHIHRNIHIFVSFIQGTITFYQGYKTLF